MSERGIKADNEVVADEAEDDVQTDVSTDAGDSDADEGDAGDDESDVDAEDHGGDDASGADEGEAGRQAEVKPLSRAQRAVLEAKRVAKEAKEVAERATREAAELRSQMAGRQTAEQQREEQARIELMDPAERAEYRVKKAEENFGNRLNVIQFQMADAADKSAFDSFCLRHPAVEGLRDQVEEILVRERRNGFNPNRETVAKFILGENALKRAGAAKTRQTKRGDANRQNQKANPGKGRSDIQSGTGRSGNDRQKRYDRLKDLSI